VSIAYRSLGQGDEAIEHAREAVRLEPDEPLAYVVLVHALLLDRSQLEQARAAAARAIELAPELPSAHLMCGAVAEAAHDRRKAEAAFRRGLALDPSDPRMHRGLARVKANKRSYVDPTGLAAAARGFATALAVEPTDLRTRRSLEHVLRVWLARVSYLIFVDAFVVARIASHGTGAGLRLLPLAVLAVPAAYAARFLSRVSGPIRAHLRQLLAAEGGLRRAVALDTLAVAALIAAALAPGTARVVLASAATITAVVSRFVLDHHVRKAGRGVLAAHHRYAIRTPILWLIVSLLGGMAAVSFVAIDSGAGAVGVVFGLVCGAGAIAILRVILRRRSLARAGA
jgi:tetratricopeptide (TPR) repeat protein